MQCQGLIQALSLHLTVSSSLVFWLVSIKRSTCFYYTNSPSKPQFSPTDVPLASLLSSWWMSIDQRRLVLTAVKLRPQCFFTVGPAGTPVSKPVGFGNLLSGQLRGETLCSTAQLYQLPRSVYGPIVLQLGTISCEWTCVHILELTFVRNVLNTS